MKNRMYSYSIATFFFCLLFSFLQIMFLNSSPEQWHAVLSGGTMLYHIMVSILAALIMECWCYFLPFLLKHSRCCTIVILILNPIVWYAPFYVSLFLKLLLVYLSILMAYQLFMYKEANVQLKKMKESLQEE